MTSCVELFADARNGTGAELVSSASDQFCDRPRELVRGGYRFYYRYRQGISVLPPIALISGAFQDMHSWEKFGNYYQAAGRSVLLMDLPGSGRADILPASLGFDFIADCLQVEAIPNIDIIAASYGTPVAVVFAQRYSQCSRRLVLAGTVRAFPDHLIDSIIESVDAVICGDNQRFVKLVLAHLTCSHSEKKITRGMASQRLLGRQLAAFGARAQSSRGSLLDFTPSQYIAK